MCTSRKYSYTPHRRFFGLNPHPPGKSSLASYFSLITLVNLGMDIFLGTTQSIIITDTLFPSCSWLAWWVVVLILIYPKKKLSLFAPGGAKGTDILLPLLAVVCCLSCYCPCVPSLSVSLLPHSATPGCFGSASVSLPLELPSKGNSTVIVHFFSGYVRSNTISSFLCLPDPVHLHSLIPNMSSLYPSISLATCSVAPALCMLRTFQCPITRVSGHDSGVDWMLSFPQGFAHHHHTVIVGPHVTARVIGCWVVHGFFNMLSFYRNRESTCCPTPYQEEGLL